MWNTMINQVQPMFNPLGFAWNAIWDPTVLRDFWSLQGPFRAHQIPQNGSQTQKKWAHQLTIITKGRVQNKKKTFQFGPGVSILRYLHISILRKYTNFSIDFIKKLGPFYKKLRCDKFGNWSISTKNALNNQIQSSMKMYMYIRVSHLQKFWIS